MFRLDAELRVYLHRDAIDFRAGINSLVLLVEQSLQLDPFARAIFAFRNRKRNRVKLLLYDRTGFRLVRAASLAARRHRYRRHAATPRAPVSACQLNAAPIDVVGKQRR